MEEQKSRTPEKGLTGKRTRFREGVDVSRLAKVVSDSAGLRNCILDPDGRVHCTPENPLNRRQILPKPAKSFPNTERVKNETVGSRSFSQKPYCVAVLGCKTHDSLGWKSEVEGRRQPSNILNHENEVVENIQGNPGNPKSKYPTHLLAEDS
jgi:hypothetical protein